MPYIDKLVYVCTSMYLTQVPLSFIFGYKRVEIPSGYILASRQDTIYKTWGRSVH